MDGRVEEIDLRFKQRRYLSEPGKKAPEHLDETSAATKPVPRLLSYAATVDKKGKMDKYI